METKPDRTFEVKIRNLEVILYFECFRVLNQELENECVDLLVKTEFANRKKQEIKRKVEFLK